MALGPGKYDAECTTAREATHARLVALIVVDGSKGSGFSCQSVGRPADLKNLAEMLRFMAEDIERSHP